MKTYAIVNQKGGVCKTTSTVSLGAVLAQRGRATLLVDLDPQASLSRWMGGTGQECTDLLRGECSPEDAVVASSYDRLDYVPADRSLAALEDLRAGKLARGLEGLLSAAEAHYDFVLIDVPPSTGSLVLTALMASEGVLAPVQASQGAIDGLSDTLALMRQVGGADLVGAFACRVDLRTISDRQVPGLLKDSLGEKAFDSFIRETVRVREAETAGVPPPYYDPKATATEDYNNLTDEMLRHG